MDVGKGELVGFAGGVDDRKMGDTFPAVFVGEVLGPSGSGRFIRKFSSSFILPDDGSDVISAFCCLHGLVSIAVVGCCVTCSSSSSSSSAPPNSSNGLLSFLIEFDLDDSENLTAVACFENNGFLPPFGLIVVKTDGLAGGGGACCGCGWIICGGGGGRGGKGGRLDSSPDASESDKTITSLGRVSSNGISRLVSISIRTGLLR